MFGGIFVKLWIKLIKKKIKTIYNLYIDSEYLLNLFMYIIVYKGGQRPCRGVVEWKCLWKLKEKVVCIRRKNNI